MSAHHEGMGRICLEAMAVDSSVTQGQQGLVDRGAGVLRNVRILGLSSKNRRKYLPEAVREAVHLYEGKQEVFARGEYFPDIMTKRAIQFIDKNKHNPFFMYVAFNIPHYPEQADKKFDKRFIPRTWSWTHTSGLETC